MYLCIYTILGFKYILLQLVEIVTILACGSTKLDFNNLRATSPKVKPTQQQGDYG